MKQLSVAEFEQVLHPIFQEDELTLVVVGGVLGLIVGYAQAIFTQPESDPNDGKAPIPPADAGGPGDGSAPTGAPPS
ncbi:hypothetical protein T492DRAFT_1051466, partial [Pavlovales sp. CCMP2436]